MASILAPDSRVVAVCSGNICRSPFLEYHLRAISEESGLALEVVSAGTFAIPGNRATGEARLVAREFGLDLEPHRAQPASEAVLAGVDLVLALEAHHAEWVEPLLADVPGTTARVEVLDVADPYGGDLNVYRTCFHEIVAAVETLR